MFIGHVVLQLSLIYTSYGLGNVHSWRIALGIYLFEGWIQERNTKLQMHLYSSTIIDSWR